VAEPPPPAPDAPPPAPDPADLTRRLGLPPEREAAVASLIEIGVTEAAMQEALRRGRIENAIFEGVLDPGRSGRTVSAADMEADGGWPAEMTLAIITAFGFPAPGADEPFFSPEEAAALVGAAQREEWWPFEVQMQVSRVWGQALAHIAATEVYRFRVDTEARVRGSAATPHEALVTLRQAMAELLPLADPLLVGIHRRWIEYELAQFAISEAEQRSPGVAIPGATDLCLFFVDLKDFTAFADLHGDSAAVAAATRFGAVVADLRGDAGQVVKGMGDGAMLVYPDVAPAVAAWRRFVAAMAAETAPPLHGSLHFGTVVRREGDYYGTAVNLTDRLLSLAGRDQLIATGAAARRCGKERWIDLGARRLRGIRDRVEVVRLAPR
jgi:adenylate cyclase